MRHDVVPQMRPNSNYHRLLHLLEVNGGTLFRAQLYKPKNHCSRANGLSHTDHPIKLDGMPKMTERNLLDYHGSYENIAFQHDLVSVQKHNNHKYITLLPKGRDVLNNFFRKGKKWEVQ